MISKVKSCTQPKAPIHLAERSADEKYITGGAVTTVENSKYKKRARYNYIV